MPFINLTVSGEEDPALAKELVETIGGLTKDVLNKKPEITVITVTFIPDHLWFVNSESLAELKMKSFYLNIKISDSTNLKTDKSKYIEAVHRALNLQLDPMHPVSYTAIEEMKADAYGYEGLTIEYKIITNQKK
jgi:4-oxalocrotonate tautomerase